MEDRNPFMPVESTFTAADKVGESESSQEKKDKKKKGRFSEWFAKFLRPQAEQDESPDGEIRRTNTRRVSEVLQGIFSKATGIEKQEVAEDDPMSNTTEAIERSLYFPLTTEFTPLDTGEEMVTYNKSEKTQENDSVAEANEHIKLSEQLVAKNAEVTEDNITIQVGTQESRTDVHEPATPEELLRDNEMPQLIDRYQESVQTELSHRKPEKEVVIEQNSGGGAALLGFVAAETLSRSRDTKIRKEAEALKKRVVSLEKNQSNQTQSLNEVRDKNREQIETLRQRRNVDSRESGVIFDHDTNQREKVPVPRSEEVVFERLAGKVDTNARPQPTVELQPETVRTADIKKESLTNDALVLEQAEQAAEQDIPLEAYYEKRHEVKDVPTSPAGTGASGGLGSTYTGSGNSQADQFTLPDPNYHRQQINDSAPASMYTQAAKQGMYLGIALIVAFLIIVFVWSLL